MLLLVDYSLHHHSSPVVGSFHCSCGTDDPLRCCHDDGICDGLALLFCRLLAMDLDLVLGRDLVWLILALGNPSHWRMRKK